MGGVKNNKSGGGGILGSKSAGAVSAAMAAASPTPVTGEYAADKPAIMPVYNSPAQIESARKRREAVITRSGRSSTNLVGNPGTQAYQSSFLGSTA